MFEIFFYIKTDNFILNESNGKTQIDGDLHINFVHRNDSGYYRCIRSHAGEHNHRPEILNTIKLDTICK